jgi:hypothetical protein
VELIQINGLGPPLVLSWSKSAASTGLAEQEALHLWSGWRLTTRYPGVLSSRFRRTRNQGSFLVALVASAVGEPTLR